MTKPIDLGFQTIWNEAPIIRGWAKTMLYFCRDVYALIDPKTDDGTDEILQDEFPEIEIIWQDRELGDSDDEHMGDGGMLIMHANQNKFVREYINEGDWILHLSADERFLPSHWPILEREIKRAKQRNCDGIIHVAMYELLDDMQRFVDYGSVTQFHFLRPDPESWYRGKAHACNSWNPIHPLYSDVPFYHFMRLRPHKELSWRYKVGRSTCEKTDVPITPYNGPKFDNWMNLDGVTI